VFGDVSVDLAKDGSDGGGPVGCETRRIQIIEILCTNLGESHQHRAADGRPGRARIVPGTRQGSRRPTTDATLAHVLEDDGSCSAGTPGKDN